MKVWTIYWVDSGLIEPGHFLGSEDTMRANLPTGCAALPGSFDHRAYRVDSASGRPVPHQTPIDEAAVARDARAERARRLQACDWTQLPDVPAGTREAWAKYRQALRDVTGQPGFPHAINWPTPPA
jgi:hypothetical protein